MTNSTTMTNTSLTRNIEKMATEVAEHIVQDRVIQGSYWDDKAQRGCFIGCLAHSNDPFILVEKYGLTVPLLRIAENIFEGLPITEAKAFFAAFPSAIGCDGRDLSLVHWQFLAAELRALPSVSAEIQQVITGMDLLSNSHKWPDAHAAAARAAAAACAACDARAAACAAARVAARAACDAAAAAATAHDAADAADAAACAACDARAAACAAADAACAAARAAACAAADAACAAARAAADAAAHAVCAADAAAGSHTTARFRQRDTLLQLIAAAPIAAELNQ